MLEGVQPVQVAEQQLGRGDKDRHDHGHAEHDPGMLYVQPPPQVVRADACHHECGGHVGGRDHVNEAIGKGGVEDDLEPVGRIEQPVLSDAKPLGRLHPAVGRENPERRDQGAGRHDDGGGKMHFLAHPVPAEKHDAQK